MPPELAAMVAHDLLMYPGRIVRYMRNYFRYRFLFVVLDSCGGISWPMFFVWSVSYACMQLTSVMVFTCLCWSCKKSDAYYLPVFVVYNVAFIMRCVCI